MHVNKQQVLTTLQKIGLIKINDNDILIEKNNVSLIKKILKVIENE